MTSSSSSSPETQAAPTDSQDRFSYKDATYDDVLEDLSSRFILNLPDEELSSLERICFQVEQAHWFYEDFIREENPKFPSLPLKKFSAMLFHACPLLRHWSNDHESAFNTFMQYKTRVPVCGAIMLNEAWDKCLLVKGWKLSSGWGFPKGKINEGEPEHLCAIREVLEETGYNLAGQLNPEDVIEVSIREQKISLYIVANVPEAFEFETRTRKEISKIEWFKLTDLPTWKRNKAVPGKFYLISPFIGPLKVFINARKPQAVPPRLLESKPVHADPVNVPLDNADTGSQFSFVLDTNAQATSGLHVDDKAHSSRTVAASVQELEAQVLDPHFARLLSSLSTSAGKTPVENTTTDEIGTPSSATLPSHNSQSLPSGSTDQTFQPSSRPPKSNLIFNGIPSVSSHTKSSKALQPHCAVPAASLAHESQPLAVLPLGAPPATFGTSSVIEEPSMSSNASSTKQIDPSTPKSRRSTSTADISPYLSRLPEVPASGKRLKQLALLESVADEATKMTPAVDRLSGQTPLLPGAVHSAIPQRNEATFLPRHDIDLYPLPHLLNSRHLTSAPRPRTSQELHPMPSVTPLYTQNAPPYQLLSTINNPPSFAINQPLPLQQSQPQPPELSALPLQSRVQLQHTRNTDHLPFLPTSHLPPSAFPRSYAADSISAKTASSLLSILNNGRGPAVGTKS